jgi:hypothetical protein
MLRHHGWRYYDWVDSFLVYLHEKTSFTQFMENLHWNSLMAIRHIERVKAAPVVEESSEHAEPASPALAAVEPKQLTNTGSKEQPDDAEKRRVEKPRKRARPRRPATGELQATTDDSEDKNTDESAGEVAGGGGA